MTQKFIATLPLLQDAQFIVVDEDKDTVNGEYLLDGWVKMWSTMNTSQIIHYLSFFHTKSYYNHLEEMFTSDNLKIHDYCSEDINNINDKREIDLDSIMKSDIVNEKSIVIINCFTSIIVNVGLAKAIRFIDKLSKSVYKLVGIYRSDFGRNKIPSIETLGTTYVQLGKYKETVLIGDANYEVSVVHRKSGGGVVSKTIMVNQDLITSEIKSEKFVEKSIPTASTSSEAAIKPQTTFRTDMNPRELQQRNQTPLPYLITADPNPVKESHIYYEPDSNDDFDEEDPDDDLPF